MSQSVSASQIQVQPRMTEDLSSATGQMGQRIFSISRWGLVCGCMLWQPQDTKMLTQCLGSQLRELEPWGGWLDTPSLPGASLRSLPAWWSQGGQTSPRCWSPRGDPVSLKEEVTQHPSHPRAGYRASPDTGDGKQISLSMEGGKESPRGFRAAAL